MGWCQMKRIKTLSGAEYLIGTGGEVMRKGGDTPIAWTMDDHQYSVGHLDTLLNEYETLTKGDRLVWWGVYGDFAERIHSSLIETIEEE